MVPSGSVDRIDLAMVCFHEAAHTAGKTHAEMRGEPIYHRVGNWRELFAWAEMLPLEKEERKKSERKSTGDQLEHVHGMLRRALTRERRARTIRQKWERRVKYYERKVAMSHAATESAVSKPS